MAALTTSLRVATFAVLAYLGNASDFLSLRQQVTKEFVEETLLGELAAADNGRIAGIQEELRPLFNSLPKNELGQLDSSAVRYALHRYFAHKHGWYVKGLTPTDSTVQNSSSAAIVSELAPLYIQELLAKQLKSTGMQLRDLAVFAATMADLIHAEGVSNLHAAYEKLRIPTTGVVSESNFFSAVRGFLSVIVVGFGPELHPGNVDALDREAREVYPEYGDLIMWLEDAQLAHRFFEQSRRNPFIDRPGISFEDVDALIHELYHHFGSFNNLECSALRDNLVANEYPNTGRVPLSKFYADTENSLRESVDYLRNQGALDEANPENPTVVIPNYISGPSRCMPFSSFFSVCCPDSCESVLGRVEAAVAEPSAEPHRIVDIVSGIPSETQPAPWNISASLVSRLSQIGAYHQGRVPLHGRLFMQWLHHAYPRECPYPHVSGTVNPVSQEEWIQMNDDINDVLATDEEMKVHMSNKPQTESLGMEHLPWTDVEELVAVHRSTRPSSVSKGYLRPATMVIAVLSFALPLARASRVLFGALPGDKVQVHMV